MEITITIGLLIGVTMGIVECIKRLGLNARYLPLISLVIGVGIVSLGMQEVSLQSALNGIVVGLTASGLFSGGKALIGK